MEQNAAFTLKQATVDELDVIAELFDQYRVFYKEQSDFQGAKDFIHERFVHHESIIFLAYAADGGQAIGFAQLYPSFSSTNMARLWILNDLYVTPEARGLGTGRGLLQAAKEYAQKTKACGLTLATAVDNFNAQKLYESSGYVKDDEFYFYNLML
ncbi:MAG: GNAT family N-acetyltransferase [Paenibacillus sp. RIFOXYA1_FULL_44_5]|nr:MAG: GNAT family N-acetyltransferase [Paenibacillus sp. RIFOXYA1_FULL_44_5]